MSGSAEVGSARTFPSVAHLALLLPWIAVGIAARVPIRDNSFLWHVRAGTVQIDLGEVLTSDPFSFTRAGQPWRTQSWLLELLYGWLDQRVGLAFVPWMVGITSALLFLVIGLIAHRYSASVLATAGMLSLSAWLGVAYLNPRPVLFSYLLLGLVVLAEQDRRLGWTVPLIVWVWAGTHASFFIGLLYLGLRTLQMFSRRRVLMLLASALTALATAHGLAIVKFLVDFAADRSALTYLREWATPQLISVRLWPFVLGIVLLIGAAIRGKLRPSDLVVVVPVLMLGLTADRSLFPAWVALVPWAARGWPRGPVLTPAEGPRMALTGLVVVLIAVVPFIPKRAGSLEEARFPIAAVAALAPVPFFHDDVAGGYLIYRSWPQHLVFIDDRAELYGSEFYREFVEARQGRPSWRDLFDQYGMRQALVRVTDPLAGVLVAAGWSESYHDENFSVFLSRFVSAQEIGARRAPTQPSTRIVTAG